MNTGLFSRDFSVFLYLHGAQLNQIVKLSKKAGKYLHFSFESMIFSDDIVLFVKTQDIAYMV